MPPEQRLTTPCKPISRLRVGVWLLTVLLLQGCSDLSRASYDTIRLATKGQPRVHPTAEQVAAKPYYQMQADSAHGSAVLILGNLDGARQDWYGASNVVVFLEHGRIVQTAGLPANLDGLQLPASDPFARGLQHLTAPLTYTLHADWSPGYRYGVPITATLVPRGLAHIVILGQGHDLQRVDEHWSAPGLGRDVTNHYWVDPHDGFVWKSEQIVAPGITLTLQQLRPYRGQP